MGEESGLTVGVEMEGERWERRKEKKKERRKEKRGRKGWVRRPGGQVGQKKMECRRV